MIGLSLKIYTVFCLVQSVISVFILQGLGFSRLKFHDCFLTFLVMFVVDFYLLLVGFFILKWLKKYTVSILCIAYALIPNLISLYFMPDIFSIDGQEVWNFGPGRDFWPFTAENFLEGMSSIILTVVLLRVNQSVRNKRQIPTEYSPQA
jgi:hypothetical protein